MDIHKAPDITKRVRILASKLPFPYIKAKNIVCIRSSKATSRARARIWSFPKIWQLALGIGPHYVIEVLSERFDHLSEDDKLRTLIHELMHIPKNFSGALVPHKGRHKHITINSVEKLFRMYKSLL